MRNKRLDVLRCIAILLVFFRHAAPSVPIARAGWVGVDLFFVLSGFLISGLLFKEYKTRGAISFKRFFIRRGFKIYPSFYFFLLGTLAFELITHKLHPLAHYLSEALYLQNYAGSVWNHTWSLAVEEHFYILLPLLLLCLIRFSSQRANPFQMIPAVFGLVAIACLALRMTTVLRIHPATMMDWDVFQRVLFPTHERIDSLFFGVLLGYFHHFRPEVIERLLISTRRRLALVLLAGLLLFPALLFSPTNSFMLTAGLTMLYLGFGIVLMLCLHVRGIMPARGARLISAVGTIVAFVGMYSYSIYLWHEPVMKIVPMVLSRLFRGQIHDLTLITVDLLMSLAVGITLSRLIEYPILALRDRLFPATQSKRLDGSPNSTDQDSPSEQIYQESDALDPKAMNVEPQN
jgi:peptidoglycan/LPS O-acetylase OafA/YrhL